MNHQETQNVDRFREAIAQRLGLSFDESKLEFLAEVLHRRSAASSLPAEAYLALIERERLPAEISALAQELTVAETYFFRNRDQYRALAEAVLPGRAAEQAGGTVLRMLSAGCASGEEPYSLVMVARDAAIPLRGSSIVAVDANPAMIARARKGRYTAWALRETPVAAQQRWFKADGREFVLDESVRAAVQFEVRNLVEDDPLFWQPGSYDVVFFRNVLMYFTPEQARAAVARVAGALKPGGYLFLGHAETLRGLSSDFNLEHTHETFYYRRKELLKPAAATASRVHPSRPYVAQPARPLENANAWIGAIDAATRRIESLTNPAPVPSWSAADEALRAAPAVWDRARTLDLLREERFTEALETMPPASADAKDDPDRLLLTAALHVHRGQLDEAEEICKRLLDANELSAGAHYLLALCRDGAADPVRAAHHDQIAIYLDPDFAMPHLHLGLLAQRTGDSAAARRELSRALPLLEREDGSRLLLYGGGFGRDALLALCRTELAGAEGRP
jgi:chemotaxis protein methyltransferase CheR